MHWAQTKLQGPVYRSRLPTNFCTDPQPWSRASGIEAIGVPLQCHGSVRTVQSHVSMNRRTVPLCIGKTVLFA